MGGKAAFGVLLAFVLDECRNRVTLMAYIMLHLPAQGGTSSRLEGSASGGCRQPSNARFKRSFEMVVSIARFKQHPLDAIFTWS